MSNAGLEEGSEEMQEIDIAEIKKLKVRPHVTAEQSLSRHGANCYIRYKNFAPN